MNYQGGRTDQLNPNPNIQNEVNPHQSINGTLGLLPSASSLTAGTGSDQGFPERHSGQNILLRESANIVPTNGRSAAVSPHESISLGLNISSSSSLTAENLQRFPNGLSGSNFLHCQVNGSIAPSNDRNGVVLAQNIDLTAEHGVNNHHNNQNLSLGLCLHPYGPQNQSATSSSTVNAINSGEPGYAVEEQDVDGSSSRGLPFKRRSSPERAFREFSNGESSRTDARDEIPKRRSSPAHQVNVNINNNVNISSFYNGPANSLSAGHFEPGTGQGTRSTVSDMQHLVDAGQTQSLQRHVLLHQTAAASNPQVFVPPTIVSTGYVPLLSQTPWRYQCDNTLIFRPVDETPVGTTSSVHPYEHVPEFSGAIHQACPWIVRPINASPPILPVYSTVIGNGAIAMAPLHNPGNIPRNTMLGLSIPGQNQPLTYPFRYPAPQYGSFPGINPSNAPPRVPRFNFQQNYVPLPSGTVNNNNIMASVIAFPRQNSESPSDMPQELNPSTAANNSGTGNEANFVAVSENLVARNPQPYLALSSLNTPEMRRRLASQVRNALDHLRNGGTLRLEELMLLDYSLILQLLEPQQQQQPQNNQQEQGQLVINGETVPYESVIVMEEQNEDEEMGLCEEEILSNIRQEIFESIDEETPENTETCCICQEDCVNREELGRVDCGHRFHINCIKQWLMVKNVCPICKQMALTIMGEEDDD